MPITIDGKKYKVIEKLPAYGVGLPSVVVKDEESQTGERVAVKERGEWRFWTVEDRLGRLRNP